VFCWAPIVLIGYLTTMPVPQHPSNISAALIEGQTCSTGVGANVRATDAGLYSVGAQYGLRLWEHREWTLTLTPSFGGAYASQPYPELPLRTNFSASGQLLIGYEPYYAGVTYIHISNAGLRQPNIGLDLLAFQVGWTF